jgi:Flp pilus assembly protein TadG
MIKLRHQQAQAVIEFMIVLPVMVLLVLGFLALQIRFEAQTELDAATSLAAAADASSPAGLTLGEDPAGNLPNANAKATFNYTINQYSYFSPFNATQQSGAGTYLTNCGTHAQNPVTPSNPTGQIKCVGHAYLTWFKIPWISSTNGFISMTSIVYAYPSTHRVCVGNTGTC